MIPKSRISLIRSLELKKNRDKHGLFLAEGEKICTDLLHSDFMIESIYCTKEWMDKNISLLNKNSPNNNKIVTEISQVELDRLSLQKSPNQVLALVHQKTSSSDIIEFSAGPVFLLDRLQDPGNFGTIIRTADWFGIPVIISSLQHVDLYNPKVIQASMGSLFRMNIYQCDLEEVLLKNQREKKWPVFAAVLNGENIYKKKLAGNGFYLFGKEGGGFSARLLSFVTDPVTILPGKSGSGRPNEPDSLNVAIAAAIIMNEYSRQQF